MIKTFNLLSILTLVCIFSCNFSDDSKLEIIPIDTMEKTKLTSKNSTHTEAFFLLRNYSKKAKDDILVDKFFCNKITLLSKNHSSFIASFYEETSTVNLKTIAKDDNNLYYFGKHILGYTWTKRKSNEIKKEEIVFGYFSNTHIHDKLLCEQ